MITQKLTDKVIDLLTNKPHLRDDDLRLVANIWHSEIPNINSLTAFEFLKHYAEGRLTNSDYITRVRRKVQEENEFLRGELWEERHKKQDIVIEQLGYIATQQKLIQGTINF